MRQDLAVRPPLNGGFSGSWASALFVLTVTTTALALVATIVWKLKKRREDNRDWIPGSTKNGSQGPTHRLRLRIAEREEWEWDQWRAWIAAMTVQRKVRCLKSYHRSEAKPQHGDLLY
jgi:hypothetical protein